MTEWIVYTCTRSLCVVHMHELAAPSGLSNTTICNCAQQKSKGKNCNRLSFKLNEMKICELCIANCVAEAEGVECNGDFIFCIVIDIYARK